MGQPAIGQASRERVATNHRALSERFTSESWRASKYASAHNRRNCAGTTKAGDPCLANVGYGARSDSSQRPTYDGPEPDVFLCHRHATALLKSEGGY